MNFLKEAGKMAGFELLMFLIIGLFWAAAMAFPLFLSSSFDNRQALPENLMIMGGPYLAYLALRTSFLLGRSFALAYTTSNDPLVSTVKKRGAEEWMTFVLFIFVWGGLIAWPLSINGYFTEAGKLPWAVFVVVLPYVLYWVGRRFFLGNDR